MKRVLLCSILIALLLVGIATSIFYSRLRPPRLPASGIERAARPQISAPRKSLAKDVDRVARSSSASAVPLPGKLPEALSLPPREQREKITADYALQQRARTRALYKGYFASVSLPEGTEEKILDVLGRAETAMFQEAEQAVQEGRLPAPPSAQEMRQQQTDMDTELRSLLGNEGLQGLHDYQASIPDQIVIATMNEAGASLSEEQMRSMATVMAEERTRVMGQPGARNLAGLNPQEVTRIIQSDQQRIHFATEVRLTPLLSREQLATFQQVISGFETSQLKP